MARIVLDVNVVISAAIKDSLTREFITKGGHEFWIPEQALMKIQKYRDLILKKSGLRSSDLETLLKRLLGYIRIMPVGQMNRLQEAKVAMKQTDPEDAVFVACALSLPGAVIWSNDKHLKKQKLVAVYTTEEVWRI